MPNAAPSSATPTPFVWASLGPETLQLQQNRGPQRGAYPIALGWSTVLERTGMQERASGVTLENAIALVEDHVMPAHRWLIPGVPLYSSSTLWLQVGAVCGVEPIAAPAPLARDAVENVFVVWAENAEQGRSAPGLPSEMAWGSALLILRECLHHWDRDALWLVPPPSPEERERAQAARSAFSSSFFAGLF